MREEFQVRIAKAEHVFSAAHFITFNGICERLHGHNYRVAVEVDGPLDVNQYVVDFIAFRDRVRTITTELDHYVLLPTQHPQIAVTADEESVTASFEGRTWVFPRGDCRLLPVSNTTSELLARYIGERLLSDLRELDFRPSRLRVEVDECDGQLGIWTCRPK